MLINRQSHYIYLDNKLIIILLETEDLYCFYSLLAVASQPLYITADSYRRRLQTAFTKSVAVISIARLLLIACMFIFISV